MTGESATPGGARQRDCTQIAQEVTKVGPPRSEQTPVRQKRDVEGLTAPSCGRLQVFAFMSERGFFCQLPFDPSHTEIGAFRATLRHPFA